MKPAYRSLALQTIVSGIIMYLVMFVMIDRLSSFYNNLNMLYMTLMMVSPMVVLMIVAMRDMFPSKRLNAVLLLGSAVAFFGSFALMVSPSLPLSLRHADGHLDVLRRHG